MADRRTDRCVTRRIGKGVGAHILVSTFHADENEYCRQPVRTSEHMGTCSGGTFLGNQTRRGGIAADERRVLRARHVFHAELRIYPPDVPAWQNRWRIPASVVLATQLCLEPHTRTGVARP